MEDGTCQCMSSTIFMIAPHHSNSGHCTIQACETSRYENHLLSLPLGSTNLRSYILNLIGHSSSMMEITNTINALRVPVHL